MRGQLAWSELRGWREAGHQTQLGVTVWCVTVSAVFTECPQALSVGIALEYGTRKGPSLDALRADHWLHRHPGAASAEQREAIQRNLLDAFYVDEDEWRGMIAGQCRTAVLQAVLGLGVER